MPDAEEENQNMICEVPPDLSISYRSDIEEFTKNTVHLQRVQRSNSVSDIEEARQALILAVTKSKIHHERKPSECQPSKECKLQKPQSLYFTKMKEYADRLPANNLLPEWEESIRNLISPKLRCRYADIFEEQILETRTRYYEAMHDFSVKRIIAIECLEPCNLDLGRIPPYKLAGRTELYPKFLKNRCALVRKYYLPHRLMRSIVARAHLLMPKYICDFGRYRQEMDYLDFNR
ncbi:uncharacterized protein LOC113464855 [Ceratina calcarata]|uniref:Uncharacterized protein LOC113464855 n=1 Tax=Ceratina calcarata TaxID=156304 RepID=A0AAJ7WEB4_9HYME|nr:uncharacterized protein LOC113464855 [Ceratina calcarata]